MTQIVDVEEMTEDLEVLIDKFISDGIPPGIIMSVLLTTILELWTASRGVEETLQ
jgi:hypothetical protein|tara:strand:- start:784 stop:948 length:165 start_codon:yes stop_codon:yes gene_type:complete